MYIRTLDSASSEDTIFISIASYLDYELKQTVENLLQTADHPENIFLSIYSQHKDGYHPDIEKICSLYNAGLFYIKDDFKNARGTCFARKRCQESLNSLYKYYLQIDSHTLFIDHWDTVLINDYQKSHEKWDRFIFSTYPLTYNYDSIYDPEVDKDNLGSYYFQETVDNIPNCLDIIEIEGVMRYNANYTQYHGDEYGCETNYFAAGFVFGYAHYFIDNPYDDRIYHSGEEPVMSIRFYCDDIKIICPPQNYCYHHYSGGDCGRRKSHWSKDNDWDFEQHQEIVAKLHELAHDTITRFYDLELEDQYAVSNVDKYAEWKKFVKKKEDK